MPDGLIRSLVVDGILGGVGGVLSFVPSIIVLFFCLFILEDLGYMSRAAFLPMILGFGCSVPAIMATRTLKSPGDRIATILAIPFMSCGAKLPVYILLAGAFFPKNPGTVVMGIYLAGVLLSLLSTILLRKTVLRGPTTPFVMELLPYRLPTLRGVFWHVWSKTIQYLRKAGTVILAASLLIWVLTTLPLLPGQEGLKAQYLATTLGILYGEAVSEEGKGLAAALREDHSLNPLTALILMLFVLIMPPSLAVLGAIRAGGNCAGVGPLGVSFPGRAAPRKSGTGWPGSPS